MTTTIADLLTALRSNLITPGECRQLLVREHEMRYDQADYIALMNWQPYDDAGRFEPGVQYGRA